MALDRGKKAKKMTWTYEKRKGEGLNRRGRGGNFTRGGRD